VRYHQRQTERRAYRAFSCQILLEAERTTDISVAFCLNKSRRPILMFGEVGETSRIVDLECRRGGLRRPIASKTSESLQSALDSDFASGRPFRWIEKRHATNGCRQRNAAIRK
jgi:hypothetical protein